MNPSSFQIDKGKGVSKEALLIIDLKSSRKDHIGNKGFSLRYLLNGEFHHLPGEVENEAANCLSIK